MFAGTLLHQLLPLLDTEAVLLVHDGQPRFANFTSSSKSACVPTMIFTSPASTSFFRPAFSFAVLEPVSRIGT